MYCVGVGRRRCRGLGLSQCFYLGSIREGGKLAYGQLSDLWVMEAFTLYIWKSLKYNTELCYCSNL